MGQNENGMLGLGKNTRNTFNVAKEIVLPDNQKVIDVKAGKNHVIALTNDGKIYGWGVNNHG
jgi:alpha-tubulin suppressor-like RCC1 family protein